MKVEPEYLGYLGALTDLDYSLLARVFCNLK